MRGLEARILELRNEWLRKHRKVRHDTRVSADLRGGASFAYGECADALSDALADHGKGDTDD